MTDYESPFTVIVEVDTDYPITEDDLLALDGDEFGTAASGHIEGHRLTAVLNIGHDFQTAGIAAIDWVTKHVPGSPVAVEVVTNEEFDRRLERPAFPQLAGVSEIAAMLDVSRQRVAELRQRPDFPAPIARLKAGPVWRAGDLSRFVDEWERKPGRPKNTIDLLTALEEKVAASSRHPAGKVKRTAAKKRKATG